MAITYRMHVKDDEPALMKHWSEQSGWDHVNSEAWENRFLRTPLGPARFAVAEDASSQQILAQFAFIPSLVCVDGQEVAAYRPFAPIITKEARGLFLTPNFVDHPAVRMYREAVQDLKSTGTRLLYSVPDPQWLLLFGFAPVATLQCAKFPLWSLQLPLAEPFPLHCSYAVGPAELSSERLDKLWQRAAEVHGCAVVRDSRGMSWKVGNDGYMVVGVERNGELIGLVASRPKGDKQWLICDLLSVDSGESLLATLAAACNLAHAHALAASPEHPIRKVAVLATSGLTPVLQRLGFAPDTYEFPLMVHVLDPTLAKDVVAPTRWYVSAND
jgi:hypothetical protein